MQNSWIHFILNTLLNYNVKAALRCDVYIIMKSDPTVLFPYKYDG